MATARTLWKGAITFGLVHIPVALHAAASEHRLDFDWLDKRSMDPVGHKRINKKTGRDIEQSDIVKGIEYEDGQYVILSPEEIAAAYPKTTQTIELEAFVPAADIPFLYFDRPYYVAPINRGTKVYALLREILKKQDMAGIARVVIQTRQHLAALIPYGPLLVLNLLRWGDEIHPYASLGLPDLDADAAGLTEREMKMGEQLVADMRAKWDPAAWRDAFKDQVLELVEAKARAGQLESVAAVEPKEEGAPSATVYDLTELLQRSLKQNRPGKPAPRAKAAASQTTAKTAPKPAGKPAGKAKPLGHGKARSA